ncbi:Insulin-degrading enzyme [Trichinella pseudospiralis]|uniref:Insulin-degrading enzyme n=1 Tax=Trichinella pseudospiralis TaxID=6337 RepID=A0A0V0YFG3_TRIPS|nr:Insulin-degrading enzyme [Trichinella pseudospiralis]
MVAVERMTSSSKVFACGATLIQPEPGNGTKIVLTAAHCIFSQIMNGAVHPQNFVVSAGVHNLYKQNEENRQTVRVRNYLCHDFSFSTQRNDIALLFLDDWIIYNKHILPICTAKADQAVPDDSICFTAGWGKTESAHLSDVLRIVDVSFYPEQTCITNPSSPFDKETMICTAGYPKKSGTCMGDSGGPLVCFVDEKFVQFGIVSWGYRCGDIAVFTKLSQFSSWLEESMNDKENYNLPVPNLRVFPSKAHAMQQMKASFPLNQHFRPHELLATVGIHDELKINNPHERTVRVKSYLHNNYNEKTLKNDIALLLLDEWITYNDHVLPICLAKYEEQPPTNSICFSAGWGKTEDNLPSKELRIVDLVFQSKEVCMLYPHSLFDWKTMLCTIGQNNKSGGDSGGPLVCYYKNKSMSMLNESAKFIKHRNDNLIKSPEDKRSYRGLELNNGLKVLLISDPTADKAAASLDVSAGHMMDPSNMPGLAHFCEHMLFLGTKKYPKDNEYQSYLVAHGGNSNAYTSTDHTNYHFDVTPEFLGGALDRFAQFFIEPLFTIDATEREVNAVDSEMRGNLQSDSWRDHQLERHLSNPKHDYNKFGTGTRKTLLDDVLSRGEDPREALLKFYQNHYSANLMALCIMGKESLDELQAAYVPTFASIENKKLEKIVWKEHPYTAKELGFRVDVVPVKDLRSINFCFPLPDLQEHYSSNPGHYIGHLLGHEASGSLEHVDDIAQLVFEYINLVRTEGVQEWIHRECEDLNKIEFRFKDKEQPMNLTTYLASALQLYPMQDVMFGPYRMDQYRPELVHMVLDQLRPDNMLMTVTSKSFENVVDSVEPWYGTSYRKQPLDGQFLQRCNCSSGGSSKFKLPDRNAFIPTDFSLADCAQQTKLPRLLTGEQGDEDPMARVWYKKDDEFLTPKTVVRLLLRSPLTNSSPGRMVEAQLYSELVFDALNEHAYNAMLAGLKYSVVSTTIGMQVSVSGYSEKLPVLLSSIIDKMLSLEVEPSTFDRLKERFIRRLRNFDMESPYQHSMYYSTLLLSDRIWSKKELLREAIGLKIEMIDEFKRELFSEMHIEALVFGNASEQNARDILSQTRSAILQKMQPKPLLASQVVRNREVKLPKGKTFVFEAQNTVHPNSAIEMILQVGLQESRLNMLLELLVQILNEPCFHQLRTVEQLGYIVFGGLRRANDTQALHIIVQSEKSPAYLDERIEAFLSQLLEDIKNMPSEEFEEHRAALTAKRLEKPKKLVSAAAKVWSEISSEQYNFERDQKEVDILKTITKEELIDFYKQHIVSDAPKRRKLSTQIYSKTFEINSIRAKRSVEDQTGKVEKIKNLSDFKNNLPLFPRIKPEMEVPQIGVLPTEGI